MDLSQYTDHREKFDQQAALVLITPEIAREWLDAYNLNNRHLAETTYEQIASAIDNDEWRVNGETITFGFNEEGDVAIVDGQHRLGGVVESGIAVYSWVIFNVEAGSWETTDIGRRRTVADMLRRRGEVDYNNLAAAARIVHRYIAARDMRGQKVTETPQQILATFEAHHGLRDSVRAASRYAILGMPRSLVAALHYLFGMVNVEDRDMFFDKLHTGTNLPDNDPILKLRDWLFAQLTSQTSKAPPRTYVVGAVAIKSWSAWREGRPIRLLIWKAGGAHPERYPVAHGFNDAIQRGGPEAAAEEAA
jgi:hypothetical protein